MDPFVLRLFLLFCCIFCLASKGVEARNDETTTSGNLTTTNQNASNNVCPMPYTPQWYVGKVYCLIFVTNQTLNRSDAQMDCDSKKGHLATVDDSMYMVINLSSNQWPSSPEAYWIDGEDVNHNDTMLTWDMKPIPFTYWLHLELDETYQGPKDCVMLNNSGVGYLFAAGNCLHFHNYICQTNRTTVTEPTSSPETTAGTNETTTQTSTTYISSVCPEPYSLYVTVNKIYCLRIVQHNKHGRVQALTDCKSTGGRLATMDSLWMVTSIISNLSSSEDYWIDGIDVYGNDTFLTWNQKPLPYFRWATNEPDGGDCLKVKKTNFMTVLFYDDDCEGLNNYICQTEPVCPMPYTPYINSGKVYCLIFVTNQKLNRNYAEMDCESTRGHLATVDSSMYMVINSYPLSLTEYWIDGEDVYHNDTMLTWDLKPLPSTYWTWLNSTYQGNKDCVKLKNPFSGVDYWLLLVENCLRSYNYICQIEQTNTIIGTTEETTTTTSEKTETTATISLQNASTSGTTPLTVETLQNTTALLETTTPAMSATTSKATALFTSTTVPTNTAGTEKTTIQTTTSVNVSTSCAEVTKNITNSAIKVLKDTMNTTSSTLQSLNITFTISCVDATTNAGTSCTETRIIVKDLSQQRNVISSSHACLNVTPRPLPLTATELKRKIKDLEVVLSVDKRELTSTKQKLNSKWDHRVTCISIGAFGTLVILALFSVPFILDARRLYNDICYGVGYKKGSRRTVRPECAQRGTKYTRETKATKTSQCIEMPEVRD